MKSVLIGLVSSSQLVLEELIRPGPIPAPPNMSGRQNAPGVGPGAR